jgi:dinuclear metal center YbgI/SA1388 family protein
MEKDLTVKHLLETLDKIASFGLAEQWDNVGLMVGDPDQKVQGVMVALDPTEEVLAESKECGADCIITHHPLIFNPLKAIYTNQPMGRFLSKALKNEISVIGCHTNLDQAVGGVNDVLATSLGMVESEVLAPTGKGQDETENSAVSDIGFGRVGRLAETLSRKAFIERLCAFFNLPALRVAGELPEGISTVAVCGGSGSELAEAAFANGAQVYITGEVKHSTARWAEASGFCIIDAGHFATENPVVESLVKVLEGTFAEKGISIPVKPSAKQKNPFTYYEPGTRER